MSNPFIASATGYYFFYVDDGYYDVQLSGSGFSAPVTLGEINVIDAYGQSNLSGYTPRLKNDIINDVFDVKTFGAKGDGSTDNTNAFNSAIAAAAATGTYSEVIVTGGPNAYTINGTVILQNGVSLRCLNGATQIKYTGNGVGILFDGVTHAHLRGCSVITTSTASTVRAIQFLATSADTKWNGVSDVTITSAAPGATIAGQYGIDMDDETSHALYWNDFRNITMIGWDYAFHLIGNSTTHEGPNANFFHGINTNSSHFGMYFGSDVAENTVSSLFCNGGGYSGASSQVCIYVGGSDANNQSTSNQIIFHADQGANAFSYLLDTFSMWNAIWVDDEDGHGSQNSGTQNQIFSPNGFGNFLPLITSTTITAATVKPTTILMQGAKPTFTPLTGAGTGATISVLNTATNGGGRFCVTTGTSPVVNNYVLQITWAGAPYTVVPEMTLQPVNNAAGSLGVNYLYYDSMNSDATDAFLRVPIGATLAASTQYCWQYTSLQ